LSPKRELFAYARLTISGTSSWSIGSKTGKRVENRYFTSERAANAHAYTENIRLRNEGIEGQILGPELRGQAIEAARRLAPYGKTICDAVDFYEAELRRQS
jgi:hypothetical protein